MASTAKRSGVRADEIGRPAVVVDVAVLTLAPDDTGRPALSVLEVRRDGERGWQLPSSYLRDQETLGDCVVRCLADEAGVGAVNPQHLHLDDVPDRDGHGWTLAVAYSDTAPWPALEHRTASTRIAAADAPGRLPYAHGELVVHAVGGIRARYASAPDPDFLLPAAFTLRELRLAHEAVAGAELQRDTFRRVMEPLLVPTGDATVGTRGRPAEIFTRA